MITRVFEEVRTLDALTQPIERVHLGETCALAQALADARPRHRGEAA